MSSSKTPLSAGSRACQVISPLSYYVPVVGSSVVGMGVVGEELELVGGDDSPLSKFTGWGYKRWRRGGERRVFECGGRQPLECEGDEI